MSRRHRNGTFTRHRCQNRGIDKSCISGFTPPASVRQKLSTALYVAFINPFLPSPTFRLSRDNNTDAALLSAQTHELSAETGQDIHQQADSCPKSFFHFIFYQRLYKSRQTHSHTDSFEENNVKHLKTKWIYSFVLDSFICGFCPFFGEGS